MDDASEAICEDATGESGAIGPIPAARLLPIVYDELRRLAAFHLSNEGAGQTLQPTALVHEVYLRLAQTESEGWNGRGHFFGAASRAIQRILVEHARKRKSLKRGGAFVRQEIVEADLAVPQPSEDLIALAEALEKLDVLHPQHAELVRLRYFSGRTLAEAAEDLEVSESTATRMWNYAKAWLHAEMTGDDEEEFSENS
jgi:RNA polymerase sigma factor (TIGR02999 family)